MVERIRHLVLKEFIQVFRERRTKFFLFVTPVIQLMIFGYVATTDVNRIRTAFCDLDQSSESRELGRRLEASGYFSIVRTPAAAREIRGLVDRGEVLCAVQVNRGFGKEVRKGVSTEIQVIVDGSDSNTATIAMSYVNTVVARYASALAAPSVRAALSKIDVRTRVWYNPDLRSRNYNVPGVIASIIMLTCLLLTSMSIVREREIGTMEQLMVSPIRPLELILGKTIPPALVGFFDMGLVTVLGIFWFGVPLKGAVLFLSLCTAVYLLSVLGIGLFISTVARTQQQAMMASFLFFQPAILLSGFATPIENMPGIFQAVTYLNPLRYFLVIVRGIFLKGAGPGTLWPEMAALAVLGAGILAASALRFRKRLA